VEVQILSAAPSFLHDISKFYRIAGY